jgi:hypothetical protein
MPRVYGQKSLIFGSFLPVNRGYAILKAISARKPGALNLNEDSDSDSNSNAKF